MKLISMLAFALSLLMIGARDLTIKNFASSSDKLISFKPGENLLTDTQKPIATSRQSYQSDYTKKVKQNEDLYLKIIEQKQQNRHIIGVREFGFFSNFFLVLAHLNWCLKHKKKPVAYWDAKFPYYQPNGYNGSTNCWEYYFKPLSKEQYQPGDIINRNYNAPDRSYIIWWDYDKMLKYRTVFNTMIKKFIHIKKPILKKVDSFYEGYIKGKKTIGMHIRGTDKHTEATPVSITKFINQAKNYPKEYQFFIATDEYAILDRIKKELKDYTVIHYNAYRSDDSQPIHYKNIPNKAILGEEILIETLLLSQCDIFIHAHSNVALAALYFNPKLEHVLLLP
jgi:hypothetical protein